MITAVESGSQTCRVRISTADALAELRHADDARPNCEGAAGYGDVDGDEDVDLTDLALFVPCMDGPGDALVLPDGALNDSAEADVDGDGDVDLRDFAAFTRQFTGADATCYRNCVQATTTGTNLGNTCGTAGIISTGSFATACVLPAGRRSGNSFHKFR